MDRVVGVEATTSPQQLLSKLCSWLPTI